MNNEAPEEHTIEIKEFGESINRLDEIKEEIFDLVKEAATIVRTKVGYTDLIYQRAEAYWIPHIKTALESNEDFGTMASTIDEMDIKFAEMMDETKEAKHD